MNLKTNNLYLYAILILVVGVTGCASTPPPVLECEEVIVTYEKDEFNTPYPIVNGKPYKLTETEKDEIGQAYVDLYCPINLNQEN